LHFDSGGDSLLLDTREEEPADAAIDNGKLAK